MVEKNYVRDIVFRFSAGILLIGTSFLAPIIYGNTVNYIVDKDYENAYLYVGLSLGIVLLIYLFEVLDQTSHRVFCRDIDLSMRRYVDQNRMSKEELKENGINSSTYQNILITDIDSVARDFPKYSYYIIKIMELIAIFIIFMNINIIFFALANIIMFINLLILRLYNIKYKILLTAEREAIDRIIKFEKDDYRIQKPGDESKRVDYNNKVYKKKLYQVLTSKRLTSFNSFVKMIMFGICIYLISIDKLNLGISLIIISYFDKINDITQMLFNFENCTDNILVAINRVRKVMRKGAFDENISNEVKVISEV
jgi:ABC-type multidrug transport system fused ATPase/permease subunit